MVRPPLWATSREIVEGARPSCLAISLKETPSASPLEISSRCSSDSTRFERRRGRGRIPPVKASSSRTESTLMRRDLATAGQSRPAPSSSHTRFFVGWSKASPSSGESRCDHPLNPPRISPGQGVAGQAGARGCFSISQARRFTQNRRTGLPPICLRHTRTVAVSSPGCRIKPITVPKSSGLVASGVSSHAGSD